MEYKDYLKIDKTVQVTFGQNGNLYQHMGKIKYIGKEFIVIAPITKEEYTDLMKQNVKGIDIDIKTLDQTKFPPSQWETLITFQYILNIIILN